MLTPSQYKPITGTFVSRVAGDTGINNWGLAEWEYEFKLYKAIGIDTIIIIRCEVEMGGVHLSGLDPRSTTWPEDPNLVSMFFRLSEKYGMKLYLGGTESLDNLYKGYWKQEIQNNRIFFERAMEMFGHYKCFHGLYYTVEALPWHFNFCDIAIGTAEAATRLAPEKKKLFSPTLYGLTGYPNTHYSLDDFERIYGELLMAMSGKLDYCAWQDKYFRADCRMGEIMEPSLNDWYHAAKRITEAAGSEFWANIETFQRASTGSEQRDFRQVDYRNLAAKLQSAAKYATKNITYEFSTCMSPNAEWGSSARLLERYLEMIGLDPAIPRNLPDRPRLEMETVAMRARHKPTLVANP
jgi:hypothetical protein